MSVYVHDLIGIVGSALIVVTYLLVQLRHMQVSDVRYSLLNAMGAGLILYSLTVDFNLSAFVIEAFWLLISCIGLIQFLKEKSEHRG